MVSNGSMNDYIEKAVKRYSSLFTLPSQTTLLLLLFAVCLIDGSIIVTALQTFSFTNIVAGLGLGAILFVLIMATDFIIHVTSFQNDLIFNLRRCTALSLYSTILWSVFTVLGITANMFASGVWFKLFLLGFSTVAALRFLVLWTISFANIGKIFFYTILMPVSFTVPVVLTAFLMGISLLNASSMFFFFLSLAISLSTVSVFLYLLDRVGIGLLGVGSFSILRAFLANWTEDLTEPFEQFFEKFGVEHDIQVSALAFRVNREVKSIMVVPAFHPGPFKNIGSSTLPYAIQKLLEDKLRNCVVAVPHGLSGHDLDLASQAQNQLVLNTVEKMTHFSNFDSTVSDFAQVKKDGAGASCQVFNNCALVTLTLAPETMEDLPSELDSFIVEQARKHGFSTAVCVDAHNSIQGHFNVDAAINPLKEAVAACLEKAASLELQRFKLGASKVVPTEFSLADGMGQGGIVATIIKTVNQTVAYVTIDGNNMVSGLREKILSALAEIGIDTGEVFTTDTHAVNAVVLTARGYHPVGEAMNHETLIKHIKQVVQEALANLGPAEAAWRTENVSNVKIIGEKGIEAMCMLVDKTVPKAKKLAISLFPLAAVAIIALLLLI